MIEFIGNRYFHLRNENISYIFTILKNGHLGHLYYGQSLDTIGETELDYLAKKDNKSAGTVKYYEDDKLFTLADTAQEYPVNGSSDYRDGAIEIYDQQTPLFLDFKYQSYMIQQGKSRVTGEPRSFADDQDSETITISLVDATHALELQQSFTIFNHQSIIARNNTIINHGTKGLTLSKMMSGVLDLPTADYDFVHLSGAWIKERSIKKTPLSQGTFSVGSLKGASSHQQNPFVALMQQEATLTTGDVYGINLVYSGNFKVQAEVNEWEQTRLMNGIHPDYFGWSLLPNTEFNAPESLLGYSNDGMNGLSQNFADFTTGHIIDPKWQTIQRPIVLNNWEATYFDFNQDKLLTLAQQGKDVGIECFVVDDGWFGQRNDDTTSLGDWTPDLNKFPNGIGDFATKIHKMGLQLGIWFEPEMISKKSNLFEQHPDWVLGDSQKRRSVGRSQYVLDFANPEVVDNIFNQMKVVIQNTQLDYIKWDMNRNITEIYSPYLNRIQRPQTEAFHRYIQGVYTLYEKIVTEFPNILIEGCAGGGGRFDLGMLYYSPQIWASDNTDAISRQKIQFGTATAYPISTISNHVSAVPNHQVGRETPIETRFNVAMFGILGYELDLSQLTIAELLIVKEQIQQYQAIRQLIQTGRFEQIISPFEGTQNLTCWALANQDQSEILIGFYRSLAEPNACGANYLPLSFINEHQNYRINQTQKLTGSFLKKIGLRFPYQYNGANTGQLKGDYQSFIYHLEEERR